MTIGRARTAWIAGFSKFALVLPVVGLTGLCLACGESNDPNGVNRGGRGGSAGTAGAAGAAGSSPEGGRGGTPDAGSEGGAAGSSMGGAGGRGSTVPAGCPEPAPMPVEGQSIVIQSVKFTSEADPEGSPAEIVLRNAGSSSVTIEGGRQGWQWCSVPAYWALTEGPDVTLPPGATFAFVPYYNTSGPRPLFRGDDPQDTNEIGIYPATGTFDEAELILAFVAWGEGSLGDSRESVAVSANLWTYTETVSIGPNDAGFIATGPTHRGSGYTGVPARCLVAPENP